MKKKILSIIICAALMLSLMPAAFASDDPEVITGTFSYLPSLSLLGISNQTHSFTYSDSYFTKSGYEYHKDLASATIDFCQASMGASEDDYAESNKNQIDYLDQCGFEEYEANEAFNKTPTEDSIGVGIAQKKIEDNGAEYTLLAVGIRGAGYGGEWAGNLSIGTEGNHKGFEIAKEQVVEFLEYYIKKYDVSGKVKIWITGYSRAAATANLTAAELDMGNVDLGNAVLSKNDLYAYTYEAPKGTTDENAHDAVFGNIHNIVNPNDVVPTIAPEQWGFTRYGVDHYVPSADTDSNYAYYYANMTAELINYHLSGPDLMDLCILYTLDEGSLIPVKKVSQKEFYVMLTDALTENFTRDDYVEYLEDDLYELMYTLFGDRGADSSDLITCILNAVSDNAAPLAEALISGDLDSAKEAVYSVIGQALDDSGMSSEEYDKDKIVAALDKDLPLVMKFAKDNPDIVVTLLANILWILDGHFGEICGSYVKTLPEEYMASQQEYQYSGAFKDVSSDDWYAKYADYVNYGRIMVGDSGNFDPDASMTRAMFVQTLYAIAGKPSASAKTSFSDVSSSQWYAKAVAWASENGIVAGFEDGTFAPNQAVTREQMALMLYKYAKSINGDTATASLSYKDAASVSEWAQEGVSWATAKGVLAGSDDGYLYPQNKCTRAQAAAMLRSFCEAY